MKSQLIFKMHLRQKSALKQSNRSLKENIVSEAYTIILQRFSFKFLLFSLVYNGSSHRKKIYSVDCTTKETLDFLN